MNASQIETILFFIVLIKQSLLVMFSLDLQHLTSDFTLKNIDHFKNISYHLATMRMCIGFPQAQCFSLALSTSTIETFIESTNSIPVFNSQFNKSRSQTYARSTPNTSCGFIFFHYDDIYLTGIGAQEVFYFPSSTPPSDQVMLFTLIENNQKMKKINLDGIVGLRLQKNKYNLTTSFIEYLYKTKQISKRNFALNYTSNEERTAYFGENYNQKVNYCNLVEKMSPFLSWNCKVTKIQIGNTRFNHEHNLIEFNSLMSTVIAPLDSGTTILNHILMLSNNSCYVETDHDYKVFICDESINVDEFPDLIISMGDTQLHIQWNNLIRIAKVKGAIAYLSYFIVYTEPLRYDWSVGLPGFLNNTIIFDIDEKRLGIVQRGVNRIQIALKTIMFLNEIMLSFGVLLQFIIRNSNKGKQILINI